MQDALDPGYLFRKAFGSIRMDIFRRSKRAKRFAYKDARRRASEIISSLRVYC